MGALIGAAQGYWIAYWRIPSFIVTLAGMLVFRGADAVASGRAEHRAVPQVVPGCLSTGFIPDLIGPGKPNVTALVVIALAGGGDHLDRLAGAAARRGLSASTPEPMGLFLMPQPRGRGAR